jgi:hypothetical protein
MICSGSVFVLDKDKSWIKSWTDGFFWSLSWILGSFDYILRRAGHRKADNELKEAASMESKVISATPAFGAGLGRRGTRRA